MALSRTFRSIQNISVGLLLQGATTLLSIVTRTCLIKWIGVGAAGLNGLFGEVIGMLSMAELGVGAAIIYNLYAPIAANDTKKICQLMDLYKKAYLIIASVTFAIGCALVPFITNIVKKVDYSDSYIRTVFFLFVCKSALSYLLSYKYAILNADQKRYVQSLITLAVRVAGVGAQVAALYFTRNYIIYMLVGMAETLMVGLIGSLFVNRHYPYLHSGEVMPKEERREVFKNVGYLFIKKLSGKITNSTDNILISVLADTLQVGFYSNYTVIYSVIRHGCDQIGSGIKGSLGNLMVTETNEHCAQRLRDITFAFFCIGFPAMMCLFAGVDTFIELWLGGEFLMDHVSVMVTCLIIGIEVLRTPLWQAMEVSGLFRRDMYISFAGSGTNLIVSIVLGRVWGIVGIFIGTVCTYVIQISLKTPLLYRGKWNTSPVSYYLDLAGYALAYVVGLFAVEKAVPLMQGLPSLIRFILQVGSAGVVSLLAIVLFWGKTVRFIYVWNLVMKVFRKNRG